MRTIPPLALVLTLSLTGAACQQPADDVVTTEAASADDQAVDVVAEAEATDAGVDTATTDAFITDDGVEAAAAVTDAGYRIAEGGRTYYFRTGESQPYLIRRGNESYTFRNGQLDRVLDSAGRDLTDATKEAAGREASAWAARGQRLRTQADETSANARGNTPSNVSSSSDTRAPSSGQSRQATSGQGLTPDSAASSGQPSRDQASGRKSDSGERPEQQRSPQAESEQRRSPEERERP